LSKITYLLFLGTFLAVGAITYNIYQPINIQEKKIDVPVVNKIKEAKPLIKKDKKIENIKSEKILELKKSISLESLEELIKKNSTYVDFKDTIKKNVENKKFSIIAEIKKASPSAGIIIKDYDPVKIANMYKSNKATCLSVLTEEAFFFRKLATY